LGGIRIEEEKSCFSSVWRVREGGEWRYGFSHGRAGGIGGEHGPGIIKIKGELAIESFYFRKKGRFI